ncbi:MAG: ankyrin repeat domain-containing protein [Planctomycetota bacterium]|nr:ankyrin repeat domain-containing protein [Planctomycetota bacterium]
MPVRALPPRPDLNQLKLQARELRRAHAAGELAAAARLKAQLSKFGSRAPRAILSLPVTLGDAQRTLAREYGFKDWASLKRRVELGRRVEALKPHPRFGEAAAALYAGELEKLKLLVQADPDLVRARGELEPPYGYFSGAMLLHHAAGNPNRGPLPENIAEIARFLLESGADANAETLGPNGPTTLGLVLTSLQASASNVAGELIDVLLAHGAKLELKGADVLNASLANHAPKAAEKLIELGAKPTLFAAAALGRVEWLEALFDGNGKLLEPPTRNGRKMPARDGIGLALLYAYVNKRPRAFDFLLEKDGNWEMTGVNNGAALHRAAIDGDLATVKRLVAKGADVNNRDNPFNATAFSWADHGKQAEVVAWMRAHGAVDLHDAVCFDLPEHFQARLKEDPSRANARLDQWDVPQGAPLHHAALLRREAFAKTLLEHGADPNALAGDGRTPLDMAESKDAAGIVALLKARGGKRAAELK